MADTRTCEQCGNVFTPGREHARFCSAACRVAWNREHTEHTEYPGAEASALDWSITAMRDAVERLATEQPPDQAHGFEMISDVVWQVTLVDATVVRYHYRAYEAALTAQDDVSGWLSPLLSAAGPVPPLRGLRGAVTAPCPVPGPSPNPIAAGPDGRRVLSRGGAADHAVTPQAPLTGSGWREHSYGGFGGGHPHFDPHVTPASNRWP